MKMSMYVLADWLDNYKPRIEIDSGKSVLSGVRLYAGEPLNAEDSFLYIGRTSEMCPGQFEEERLICANGPDRILIDSEDIHALVNRILEAFHYYGEWETSLKDAAYSGASLQALVDLSYPIFRNPIFMVDWYGKVLGITRQSAARMDGTTWETMLTRGYLPVYLYDVVRIDADLFQAIENSREVFFLSVPDYDYHCIHCTIFIEDKPFMNFEIAEEETRLTEGTRQLAEMLREAILIALRVSNTRIAMHPKLVPFSEMLSGRPFDPDALNRVLSTLGWGHTNYWYLIKVLNPYPGNMPGTTLLQHLQREFSRGLSLEWEGHLLMLVDLDDWTATQPRLTTLLKEGSYLAGVSLPITKLRDLPTALKQAEMALKHSSRDSVISACTDHAWGHLLTEFARHIKIERMHHPAVETLKHYDAQNGTEYSRTLYEYLRNERNSTITAHKLSLHRNSLRYRLERIDELIDLNLEDPDVRSYVMLSFQLDRRKQRGGESERVEE